MSRLKLGGALVLAVSFCGNVQADDVGASSSIAVGVDGLALISYHDGTNGDLKVAHCSDLTCSSATITTLDSDGDVGRYTSLAIGSDGLGVIGYYGLAGFSGILKVAHCSDIPCTAATISTLVASVGVHNPGSRAIAIGSDGLPLVVYNTSSGVLIAHCSDVACTSTSQTVIPGSYSEASVAIGADGLALVVFAESSRIIVARCSDVACTTVTQASFSVSGGPVVSLSPARGADGRLLISYLGDYGAHVPLGVAHCLDPPCTSANVAFPDPSLWGFATSLTLGSDGLGLIAHTAYQHLVVAHCNDAPCTTIAGSTLDSAESGRPVIAIGSDGLGLISYADIVRGVLKVAHCSNVPCTSATISVVDPGRHVSDLRVTINDSHDPINTSDQLSYHINVTNLGPDRSPLVKVTVALPPSGFTLSEISAYGWSCQPSAGIVTCIWSSLNAGVGSSFLITGSTTNPPGEVLTTTVSVSSASVDPVPENDSDTETTTVVVGGTADMGVSVTDSPDPVTGLQSLTYDLQVSNNGPSRYATNVTLTHFLPAGAIFQGASGAGWTCQHQAGAVNCTRPSLDWSAVGSRIIVQVTAPPTAQLAVSTATVSSAGYDPRPVNDSATTNTTVTAAPAADLGVTLSDGGATPVPGQPFTWTLGASNSGPDPAANTRVRGQFPPEVTEIAWTCTASSGSSCASGAGTGDIDTLVTLAAGGTATLAATGTVGPGVTRFVSGALVEPAADTYDPDATDNSAGVVSSSTPAQAYVLAPCRLVDTRSDGTPLLANSVRNVAVGGVCGVPADASAVAIVVTAVNPGERGNLRVYPYGMFPPVVSAVNFVGGHTRASNATIALGTAASLSVRCDMLPGSTASTHLVMDVFAYFR